MSSIFLRRIMVLDLSTNLLQQDILSSSKSAAFFRRSTQPVPKLDEEITDETNEPIHHDIGQ